MQVAHRHLAAPLARSLCGRDRVASSVASGYTTTNLNALVTVQRSLTAAAWRWR
jgi:hypothetical protein